MSWLSDIFGGDATQASNDQVRGLVAGEAQALPVLNNTNTTIQGLAGQALAPYQQNYQTATQGTNALANLLGLGGASGDASALTALQATPGYQFTQQQGNNSINAANAASGTLSSGNQIKALADYDTGLASQTYQNSVSNLNPFLSLLTPSAAGEAGVLGGETSAIAGNNNQIAQLLQGTQVGAGNAQASGELAKQASGQSLLGGALSLGSNALGALTGGITSGLSGLSGLFTGGGAFGAGDLSAGMTDLGASFA